MEYISLYKTNIISGTNCSNCEIVKSNIYVK